MYRNRYEMIHLKLSTGNSYGEELCGVELRLFILPTTVLFEFFTISIAFVMTKCSEVLHSVTLVMSCVLSVSLRGYNLIFHSKGGISSTWLRFLVWVRQSQWVKPGCPFPGVYYKHLLKMWGAQDIAFPHNPQTPYSRQEMYIQWVIRSKIQSIKEWENRFCPLYGIKLLEESQRSDISHLLFLAEQPLNHWNSFGSQVLWVN